MSDKFEKYKMLVEQLDYTTLENFEQNNHDVLKQIDELFKNVPPKVEKTLRTMYVY